MIYLISQREDLFNSDLYSRLTVEESLELLNKVEVLQLDTETTGLNPHLNTILTLQLGSDAINTQVVIDCTTIDIALYKSIVESKFIIGHNLKFDLQFLYNYRIIPRRIWDTMIIEQLLHLGYPSGEVSYSLQSTAKRRLGVYLSKEVRGEILYKGLTSRVVEYAGNDVRYLEEIAKIQKQECIKLELIKGAILENNTVPAMAYLEWCGIKLDIDKWKSKMTTDKSNLERAIYNLNTFLVKRGLCNYYTYPTMGDLFEEVDFDSPIVTINWASSQQVIKLAKELGFNTITTDKKTGEEKDSVLNKLLGLQKGIDDEFLQLYFEYQKYAKVVSSFGQAHLDAINPITGRLHTTYKQLGAASGRMTCGGSSDEELARFKKLPKGSCKHLNIQQLPSDHITRECFVAEVGNIMCSADYSALESRLGADIYNEPTMIKEYLEGSGDIHSLAAKGCFPEDLKDVEVKDIKKIRPDLRKKAKAPEFKCRLLVQKCVSKIPNNSEGFIPNTMMVLIVPSQRLLMGI